MDLEEAKATITHCCMCDKPPKAFYRNYLFQGENTVQLDSWRGYCLEHEQYHHIHDKNIAQGILPT